MSRYYNPNAYLSKIKDRDWPVLYQFVEFSLFLYTENQRLILICSRDMSIIKFFYNIISLISFLF